MESLHESFAFSTPAGATEVIFCGEICAPALPAGGGIYVADSNTWPLLKAAKGFDEAAPLVALPAGEEGKTLGAVESILEAALKAGLARDSLFVGFGGGVITDMAAFAASVYMRGARLELVPTTLLAMADAAIGGKTGVDFCGCKNSVGTFYPAQRIRIAAAALDTLSEKEFRSGLAEVFKTALLYDEELYSLFMERKKEINARDRAFVAEAVRRCARAKAAVVERDVYERGERAFLNLGHTFGHALEAVAGFGNVSHGEAVAWGIGRALALGERMGITDGEYRKEVCALLGEFGWCADPVHPALANEENAAEKLFAAMQGDKKRKGGELRFILQRGLNSSLITVANPADVLAVLQ